MYVCVCVVCVCVGGEQMIYIYLGGDSVSFLWCGTTYAVQVKMFFQVMIGFLNSIHAT